MNIHDFSNMRQAGKKISMVTCYDYWSAKIIAQTGIDCVLVGDSAAMVIHGYPTTIPATLEMMKLHTQAVVRGAGDKFIIADLPFLTYRKDLTANMDAMGVLMQAGAHALKLEGAAGNYQLIEHAVASGIPIMGHLGLTPQSVYQLGGFHVQGKQSAAAEEILNQAIVLEQAGCFAIVLECIPTLLAKDITERLHIPTIGIGAGPHVSGQVLVLQDLLGLQTDLKPKFVKQYLNGFQLMQEALEKFNTEVKQNTFPDEKHSY